MKTKTILVAFSLAIGTTIYSQTSSQEYTNLELNSLIAPFNFSSKQIEELEKQIYSIEKEKDKLKTTPFIDSNVKQAKLNYIISKGQMKYFKQIKSFNPESPVYLNNDIRQRQIIESSKIYDIKSATISGIIELFVEREFKLNEFNYTRLNSMAYANDDIDFHEHTYNTRSINEDFSKKIAELLSIEDYKNLFRQSLEPIIKRTSEKRLQTIKKNYNINEDRHLEKLKKITDQYAEDKIIVQHYYTYDHEKLHVARVNLMFEESNTIMEALTGFNIKSTNLIDLSSDSRVTFFVKRCKEAGIPEDNIKKLVYAIKEREKKINKYYEDLAIWQSKYLIYYFHSAGTPEMYNKELKAQVSNIMTIDQFEKMFLHQFQGRIDRESDLRIAKLNLTYRKLSKSKLKILGDMIKDQVKQERILYEYYSYDHENAMQKVRASKYKFDKKYKKTLEEIMR
ncbi:hypothetical protein [Pseudotamlana carrageenivorans]|uniref:Uncharacterized protein n=1 Tax=Pseudotamlana carrageenivorans TaxID=2069432 RepID=A0A2I7SHG9_9FLAO|nr:hypothetical protein [Tamlana carrageenivorans]AUS05345.1 hypothetical protein C1A40_07580 [Tamlana carrageenivorans]